MGLGVGGGMGGGGGVLFPGGNCPDTLMDGWMDGLKVTTALIMQNFEP